MKTIYLYMYMSTTTNNTDEDLKSILHKLFDKLGMKVSEITVSVWNYYSTGLLITFDNRLDLHTAIVTDIIEESDMPPYDDDIKKYNLSANGYRELECL